MMLKALQPGIEARHLGPVSKPLVLSLDFLLQKMGIRVVPMSCQAVHVQHLAGVRWAFNKHSLNEYIKLILLLIKRLSG